MARKPTSDPFWVWERLTITVGALAAGLAVLGATKIDAAREQGTRLMKVRHFMEWRSKTIDDGPGIWGLSYNLSASEVGFAMTSDPQIDTEPTMETVRRNVFPIGYVPRRSTQTGQITAAAMGYEGAPGFKSVTPPSWETIEGAAMNVFYFVPATGVAHTTGMILELTVGWKMGWLND